MKHPDFPHHIDTHPATSVKPHYREDGTFMGWTYVRKNTRWRNRVYEWVQFDDKKLCPGMMSDGEGFPDRESAIYGLSIGRGDPQRVRWYEENGTQGEVKP